MTTKTILEPSERVKKVTELLEQGMTQESIFQILKSEGLVGKEISETYYEAYSIYLEKQGPIENEREEAIEKTKEKANRNKGYIYLAIGIISVIVLILWKTSGTKWPGDIMIGDSFAINPVLFIAVAVGFGLLEKGWRIFYPKEK